MKTLLVLACLAACVFASSTSMLYEWVKVHRDWQDVGRAPASKKLMFAIGLPHPNRKAMEALFWEVSDPDSPKYRQFLSFEEIHRMSDPGAAVVGPVLAWLHSAGSDVSTKVMGETILVEAPVRAIERLFSTEMAVYRHVTTRKSSVRHRGKCFVPAELRSSITLVEGIHEFPHVKKQRLYRPTPVTELASPTGFAFTSNQVPSTYYELYDLPAGGLQVLHGSSNGIFAQEAADGSPSPSDLETFDQAFGITPQKFNYNGQPDPTIGLEATLDVQMLTTIAQGGNTTFFMQQAWMYTFSTYLLSLGTGCPLVISVSYGWAEANECSDILHDIQVCQEHGWSNNEYIYNTDQQFIKLGLAGRTFVVCSQDEGAPGETNDDCSLDLSLALYPEYPASSAFVTAVGATAILGSGPDIGSGKVSPQDVAAHARRSASMSRGAPKLPNPCTEYNCTKGPATEIPCYLQNADFTTGGGFSQVDAQPAYQAAVVQAYLKSGVTIPPSTKFNTSNRAYPDIGAIGQNNLVVYNGQWFVTGGTSASTPLTSGIMTLLNDFLLGVSKAPLGFVNPLLYKMVTSCPNCFHAVTQGNNYCTEEACCKYGYDCNPQGGWAPVCGVGSPSYTGMLAYIQNNL